MKTSATLSEFFGNRSISIPVTLAVLLALIAAWYIGPLAQNSAYHQFADNRALLLLPNAGDVLSNLPFCLIGFAGLRLAWRQRFRSGQVALAQLVFFAAVLATGFGSAYYHFAPTNATLVWDRLPMAVAFMSLLATILAERVERGFDPRLFALLVMTGVGSVLYWNFTDDLRLYALVQFGSLLTITCLLLKAPRTGDRYLWLALGLYVMAKLLEAGDAQVFAMTSEWVSGHSLKHLVAALAPLTILRKLEHNKLPEAGFARQ